MYKLILCLILITSTTMIGNWFSCRIEQRLQTLGIIVQAISKMKTLICFTGGEVYTVVAECFETSSIFKAFCNLPQEDTDFSSWWCTAVDNIDTRSGLIKEDKELLKRFSDGLGVSDVEGQAANCDLYSQVFREQLEKSEKQVMEKARLYRILGFSLGCVTSLLML